MKTKDRNIVSILRAKPKSSRRGFLKKTGGLTLAAAFGMGFVANRQQLLATTSGTPAPVKYVREVKGPTGTALEHNKTGEAIASGAGTVDVHIKWTVTPVTTTRCVSTYSLKIKVDGWTDNWSEGNANGFEITSGYTTPTSDTDETIHTGKTWPWSPIQETQPSGGAQLTKRVSVTIDVDYSYDSQGVLQVSTGNTWTTAEATQRTRNIVVGGSDVELRIRDTWCRLGVRRQLALGQDLPKITWIAKFLFDHHFDMYKVDWNGTTAKIESGNRQYDLNDTAPWHDTLDPVGDPDLTPDVGAGNSKEFDHTITLIGTSCLKPPGGACNAP